MYMYNPHSHSNNKHHKFNISIIKPTSHQHPHHNPNPNHKSFMYKRSHNMALVNCNKHNNHILTILLPKPSNHYCDNNSLK